MLTAACAAPPRPPAAPAEPRPATVADPDAGSLSFTFANDVFAQSDNNFTNGAGFVWTSRPTGQFAEGSFLPRFVDALSFLPVVGDADATHHVSFAFGQTMATPSDITDPNPPLDDQPYAGLLSAAAAVHARKGRTLHTWTLLAGMVGPSSFAEDTQKAIHEFIDSDEPLGWDTQLADEFVVNVYYDRRYRALQGRLSEHWSSDLVTSTGGGLGTAWIGAWGSVIGRVGYHLPDDFGPSVPRTGQSGAPYQLDRRADGWRLYGFAGLDAQAVARNIFLDGNTWKDSRSVDSEPLVGGALAGLGLTRGGFTLTFAAYKLTDTYETQRDNNSFGAATVSFRF